MQLVTISEWLQKFYVGCSGWSYDGWLGHFYPSNLDRKDFLKYYSQVFDDAEIDSSFYRPPNLFLTKRWAKVTPDNFRFTAKFPRTITHEKRLADPEKELRYFLDMMRPLQNKLLTFLTQLPLSANGGLKKLERYLTNLDVESSKAKGADVEARTEQVMAENLTLKQQVENLYKILCTQGIIKQGPSSPT